MLADVEVRRRRADDTIGLMGGGVDAGHEVLRRRGHPDAVIVEVEVLLGDALVLHGGQAQGRSAQDGQGAGAAASDPAAQGADDGGGHGDGSNRDGIARSE